MSMFDSLKSKLGIDPEGDSYIDDTEDEIFAGGQGAAAQNYSQAEVKQHSNKVVNINATTQLQVVLVKPERFEDASTIADQLNAKRTVVLNLESTGKEVSRRLIDFLSGVAYANNGQEMIRKRCNGIPAEPEKLGQMAYGQYETEESQVER